MKILTLIIELFIKVLLYLAAFFLFKIYVFPDIDNSGLSISQIIFAKLGILMLNIYIAEIIFKLDKYLSINIKNSK